MTTSDMQMSFRTAIINAMMTNKILVVVEGKDDLSIYFDLLSENIQFFNIKPIEYFKKCSPGCKEIEDNIDTINSHYPEGHTIYKHFKGIVDRDSKYYRGELKDKNGLYYLNAYSFENNFVTEQSILTTVKLLTSISAEQLNSRLSNKVIALINNQLIDFYYICLEALRNAVDNDYNGLIGFSGGYERLVHDANLMHELNNRKEELDKFAQDHRINCDCILNMKLYCKGKWHLRYFISKIHHFAATLHEYCGSDLTECPYCETGNHGSCLYRQTTNMNVEHIIRTIKNDIKNADLDYLRDELTRML